MVVTITLTSAGLDSGPFDLYSNSTGSWVQFENNVSRSALLAGYLSGLVPDSTTIIKLQSDGICSNYIELPISTTTTTSTSTTTTTTTSAPTIATIDINNFSLDVSINVTAITVNGVTITQTGGTSPLLSGNSANAETTQLGTYTIYVTGSSTIVNQHITVTDSLGTTQCLAAGGGASNWTFPAVVINGITNVIIDIQAGVCI